MKPPLKLDSLLNLIERAVAPPEAPVNPSALNRVEAVLLYVKRGQPWANRPEYTLAVWRGAELVPIARAEALAEPNETKFIDEWVKSNTLERFGPVHSVVPTHVFELSFEGILKSRRHKSGVILRAPRILRRLVDKKAKDADTIELGDGVHEWHLRAPPDVSSWDGLKAKASSLLLFRRKCGMPTRSTAAA